MGHITNGMSKMNSGSEYSAGLNRQNNPMPKNKAGMGGKKMSNGGSVKGNRSTSHIDLNKKGSPYSAGVDRQGNMKNSKRSGGNFPPGGFKGKGGYCK